MKKILVTLGAISFCFYTQVSLADEPRLVHGKELFIGGAQPIACALCHTLDNAGTTGTIGPNLDELKPDEERIRRALLEGMGAMPSFEEMEEDDREAIIEYVLSAIKE